MGQLQGFAERAEEDGVLADVIADADGVDADFVGRPLADEPLAAMAQLRLAHRLLDHLREMQGSAAGCIGLEAMMALEDLDVKAPVA